MAIQCPRCHRQYDVALFQFHHVVRCDCGAVVDLERGHVEDRAEDEQPRPESSASRGAGERGGASTELVLVRHAEAAAEGNGAALSERGRRQALDLAERFLGQRLAAAYSSEASACRETAATIAQGLGLQVQATPLLREPGAEDEEPAQARRPRVAAFVRELVRRHAGSRVLVVAGSGVCMAALLHVLGLTGAARAPFRVDPGSVQRIEVVGGVWRVAMLNDTCHLGAEGAGS